QVGQVVCLNVVHPLHEAHASQVAHHLGEGSDVAGQGARLRAAVQDPLEGLLLAGFQGPTAHWPSAWVPFRKVSMLLGGPAGRPNLMTAQRDPDQMLSAVDGRSGEIGFSLQDQDRFIYTVDHVLDMLDALLEGRGGPWWDGFFADRTRSCPFFVEWPDENLTEWLDRGLIGPGRVLELGCGNGRNAVYLARRGFSVDAADFSARAIDWARERAATAGVAVNYQCRSVFDMSFSAGSYDLVY